MSKKLISHLRPIKYALLLAFGAVVPAHAAFQADASAPGNQQAGIGATANGNPQINIQAPSAGGVSRNVYTQFDVDRKGVILNNSSQNVQTQTGGMVAANPWLAHGEASVILNEVNSRNPSKLGGYIEVAGKKAQVIIANPSGITCDGCGFINVNRATLTTGQVQMANGQVSGYDVSRGDIIIQGGGMDMLRQDYTDIIARSVKVNANILANDLAVTTGQNLVNAANTQAQAKNSADATSPAFALDVAALGGMYAGKIRLTGTEKGVGVNNAGRIGSDAGSIAINNDGTISNRGTISGKDISIATAGNVINQGLINAQNTVATNATGALTNTGTIMAAKDITLTASDITSSDNGLLLAGVNSWNTGNLTLKANNNVNISGQMLAAEDIAIDGANIDLSRAKSYTSGNVKLTSTVGNVNLAQGKTEGGSVTINAAGGVNNTNSEIVAKNVNVNGSQFANSNGKIQANDLTLVTRGAEGVNNVSGQIVADSVTINAGSGKVNNVGGKIQSNGLLALSGGDVQNTAGFIVGKQTNINASTLNNSVGFISGDDGVSVTATDVNNTNGQISSNNGSVTLASQTLNNQQGKVLAGNDLLVNSQSSTNNRGGYLSATNTLKLTTGALQNNNTSRGGIDGTDIVLAANTVDNTGGRIQSSGMLDATINQQLNNQKGMLFGGSALTLQGDALQINNKSGTLYANNRLDVTAKTLSNDGIALSSGTTSITLK